ncbi:hypothetical protein Peur_022310 [Populus x canadensis]
MLSALLCTTHGALSLDGGMIKKNGLFALGSQQVCDYLLSRFQMEDRIRKLRWEQYNTEQDMLREQQLLHKARAASSGKP